MITEIETAVKFLSDFLRSKNNSNNGRQSIKKEQVEEFAKLLNQTLLERFQGHWHPAHPLRGSGYRCIINQSINGKIDPILLKVGRKAGIPEFLLRRFMPVEMALWIDPSDVSYRIGEQGSVCSLISPEKENEYGGGGYGVGGGHASSTSSTVSMAGGHSTRTNSLSFSSPRSLTPEKLFQQQHLHQQQQQQQQQRLTPDSPRTESTSSTSSSGSTNPSMGSDDSGIELSPSSSPRPHNTISNSSSPSSSPLASPIREQPPTSMSSSASCKEQFASRANTMAHLRDMSSVSPSKIGGVVNVNVHTPLTSFVR